MSAKKTKTPKTAKTESKKVKPAAEAKAKAAKQPKEPKQKRVSALDAAATVLAKAGKPMHCTEMIQAMAEQGLWSSPNGKTPAATLYSAILREVANKGGESRFRKADRGQFESTGKGA